MTFYVKVDLGIIDCSLRGRPWLVVDPAGAGDRVTHACSLEYLVALDEKLDVAVNSIIVQVKIVG